MPQGNDRYDSVFDAFARAVGVPGSAGAAGATGAGGAAGAPGGHGGGGRGGGGHGPGILEVIASWSRKALVVLLVVTVVALAAAYWWFHPALNLQSPRVWGWVLGICAIVAIALLVMSLRSSRHGKLLRRLLVVPGSVVAAFLLGALLSMPFVPGNAERYANVLQTTDGDFASDIEQVDYSEVPVIDRDSAALLGSRAMGSIPEYVSQFEISDAYSQINYHGRPVRVSPLTYADLFKWLSNRDEGIPAYVLVDMATQEAQVVKLDQPIKYSESEPLARNVDRYVQLRYPGYLFDQKSFELDEEGTPWWVFPAQSRTIGLFGGTTISRVVLVNACTGETADYAIADCPEWVDRAYPADLIVQQYNWSGAYQDGWLNSWLGQRGVVSITRGTDGQYGYNYLAQDGDIYLYSGVSSVTADSSNVGFILVNQRTGQSRYYPVAGATEESAMSSAEGQVQHLGYQATYPLLLNVAGQPTYFMALKDAAGLVKMYAMINVEKYQTVATGSTVAECQEAYLAQLSSSGALGEQGGDASAQAGAERVEGRVRTIAQAVVDGNSHFYVTLEGDGRIFDFALPAQLGVVRFRVGDQVAFSCTLGQSTCTVTSIEDPAAGDGAGAGADAAGADDAAAVDGAAAAGDAATAADAAGAGDAGAAAGAEG